MLKLNEFSNCFWPLANVPIRVWSVKPERDTGRRPTDLKRDNEHVATRAPIPRGRLWCFRCLTLLLPLIALGLLEFGLRLAGYGQPTAFFLKTQRDGQTLLTENPRFGWRFFPRATARTPRPLYLEERKPPGVVRIFVFGESAAFGDPAPAFGLPRVLEVLLRNRYPDVRFEVINVAMTAINSHVILPIAKDCAGEEGDVWVLYMGNNEVVGPYGGGTVFGPQVPSRAFIRTSLSVNASRTGQMLGNLRDQLFSKESEQPANVSLALFLDQKVRHDDPRMDKVYAHFARNLADILEFGTRSGAKVVVSTVASNLKDCAPFASMHRPDLSEVQKAEWDRHYQTGTNAELAGELSAAMNAYDAAAKIDDHWANLQFRQARVKWTLGDFPAALHHYTLARDYDTLRFRADSRINGILRQTCSNRLDEGISLLDGNEVLAQHSPHGVPGQELLYEHVHLNFTGNYWLGRAIAEQITDVLKPPSLIGKVPARSDWLSEEECSARLGLNDWDRSQTMGIVRQRLENPPFTLQLNQPEQHERVRKEIAQCQRAISAQSLTVSVQRCEQALALNPKDWVLHQKLAQLLKQSSNPALQARACEEWREVIALMPRYPEAHYELGVLLERTGQVTEAETQLRLALELSGDDYPDALNALGHVLTGQNRLPEAVVNYERAVKLKPSFPDALVNLGVALDRLGKKAEAKTRLEAALRLSPTNAEAAVALGQLLNEKGDVSAAIAHYTEFLLTNPADAGAHYKLARCLGFLGRSPEAQEHYIKALQIQPDFAEAHADFAMELAKSGNEPEALNHLRESVRLQPDSRLAHKNLGVALARQQKFEEAAKEFEETIRLCPGDEGAQKLLQAARRSQAGAK
jgi:tetratricopeptide (TPR) repeat protein